MRARSREDTLREILSRRVSAIIRTDDQQTAAGAIEAAIRGGFGMVEFTLTTPGALELVGDFSKRHPDVLVGAGTVLAAEQAEQAVRAGARFVVSPVCDPDVIAHIRKLGGVSIAGTFTPTEMLTAHRAGADLVKLFPAPAADVAQFVSAVLGPMPFLRIFPTAGVDVDNLLGVLRAGAAGVGFVKALFAPADLAAKDFAAIEKRAAAITRKLGEL